MDVASVLSMNPGDGKYSYADNSLLQRIVISKSKPFLVEAINNMVSSMISKNSNGLVRRRPACFRVADLGCSSGPNALQVMSEIINTIDEIICNQEKEEEEEDDDHEIQIFLNDLPSNDFNGVLKDVDAFYNEHKINEVRCFVSAVAGSFYGRLFPRESLHFLHSSSSLHWLSKVPDGIDDENRGNIYIGKSSPVKVYKAYQQQFEKDFSKFLSLRRQEMKAGGCMLLILIGRSFPFPHHLSFKYSFPLWDLLATSLMDLVAEGIVKEKDMDSFNMPYYTPYKEEVREIVEKEGSFNLDKLETFEVSWDLREDVENLVLNQNQSGKIVSDYIRAIVEPMLIHHFGFDESIIRTLFHTYSDHVDGHLCHQNTNHVNILVSLTKK